MTQLAVERIKFFSTRSPWWCAFLSLGLTIGFAGLMASQSDQVELSMTQYGYRFGLMVVMVMAALAVTTEYRFGTIRATFQAVPNRNLVLLAKTAVVAVVSLILGELAAFGSWAAVGILAPGSDLALDSADAWRHVAGVGLVFMVGAVLAVGVGTLLRQTAGAVAVILLWSLLVESMVSLIPEVGDELQKWMPFTAAGHFLMGGGQGGSAMAPSAMPFGPWAALAYFAAISVGVLAIAMVAANRRDA